MLRLSDKLGSCGYCRYCDCDDLNKMISGKFRCTKKYCMVAACEKPKDPKCYWQVPSYNLRDRDPAYEASKNYFGFYITTMIFNKLGLDDSEELDILRAFKKNYLEIKENGFINEYNILGPRVANAINVLDKTGSISRSLYEFYIRGTLECINVEDFEGASELYIAMYERLKTMFNLNYTMETLLDEDPCTISEDMIDRPFVLTPISNTNRDKAA